MLVNVTQVDINEGMRHNGEACPIAHALEVATGHEWAVTRHAARERGGAYRRFLLPAVAMAFIAAFDSGGRRAVRPIEFFMEPTP